MDGRRPFDSERGPVLTAGYILNRLSAVFLQYGIGAFGGATVDITSTRNNANGYHLVAAASRLPLKSGPPRSSRST